MSVLRAGHDRGRIYRVRPAGKPLRPIPRLDRLDAAGLVAALDTPNGTVRDLAAQMLRWGEHRSAAPALLKLAASAARPEVRVQALCVLDGLKRLTPEAVKQALADPHPGVRRHAVRLADTDGNPDTVGTARFDHLVRLPNCDAHRLFADDMLAGIGGSDSHGRVQPVGRADADDLEALIGQQVAPVGVVIADIVFIHVAARAGFVEIRNRDDIAVIGQRTIGREMADGDAATADDADPELFVLH